MLAQAITLSTVIVAHNNALLALLVSNNFAEIKSNVFKRFSKDNIQSLVYFGEIASLLLSFALHLKRNMALFIGVFKNDHVKKIKFAV